MLSYLTPFPLYFNYIAAASAPIHAFLEFLLPVLLTISFSSHRLIPVAMTIVNPQKEYRQSQDIAPSTSLFSSPVRYRMSYEARVWIDNEAVSYLMSWIVEMIKPPFTRTRL